MAAKSPDRVREHGFALVLAILSLMLLTFLGLTLAATTSTELQISANHRWSLQALYNAEAGLEAGRVLLGELTDPAAALPPARPGTWPPAQTSVSGPLPIAIQSRNDAHGFPTRNFEGQACDYRGNGMGYGVVLDADLPGAPFQNVTTIFGQTLNGAFTVWVRRQVVYATDTGTGTATASDSPTASNVILTAEGTAPYAGDMQASAFAQERRAVRVLEALTQLSEDRCPPGKRQTRQSGFMQCETVNLPVP